MASHWQSQNLNPGSPASEPMLLSPTLSYKWKTDSLWVITENYGDLGNKRLYAYLEGKGSTQFWFNILLCQNVARSGFSKKLEISIFVWTIQNFECWSQLREK